MRWQYPWVMWLAVPWAAWLVWQLRKFPNKWRLFLRAFALLLVLLALAQPTLRVWETRVAVVAAVDTSRSLTQADLERASTILRALNHARGRHELIVMPFARRPRSLTAEEAAQRKLHYAPGEDGGATDLETALQQAMAALPMHRVPKVVLISDGKENVGSVLRAAFVARSLHIPVDTYALAGRPRPAVRLERLELPGQIYAGEPFSVELLFSTDQRIHGRLEFEADGRALGGTPVSLQLGANRVLARIVLDRGGTFELKTRLTSSQFRLEFLQALQVQEPKVLLVTPDPPVATGPLVAALQKSRLAVEVAPKLPERRLERFAVVILSNCDLQGLERREKEALEAYVRHGGGLLVIAGENNIYRRERHEPDDPLNRALPARLLPPRSPESTSVVLILDKSSSMEGRKIELAKLAAVGVVDQLRPEDRVGVLTFDNSFQWAVPIRRAEERSLINRLISGIVADGGTQIAPALEEGYRQIRRVQATYRHIVLLTDGISEEGNSLSIAREAAAERITISTVGLGEDVNKAYLQKVAEMGGGRCYLVKDPSELARILLKDVLEHIGSTAVQKEFKPVVVGRAQWFEHVPLERAPALSGYVRFETKPTAEVLIRASETDPLLVRWQYGLGRAAVFTSDAKGHWATAWLNWEGYDLFWTNLVRDLLPRSSGTETRVVYHRDRNSVRVHYRLAEHVDEPPDTPELFLLGPEGFHRKVPLVKLAPRQYVAEVDLGKRNGFFRLRPLDDDPRFPEVAFHQPETELSEFGCDVPLLQQIAQLTGGQFQPKPEEVFSPRGRAVPATLALWPGLLWLAIAVSLAELWIRHWQRSGRDVFAPASKPSRQEAGAGERLQPLPRAQSLK